MHRRSIKMPSGEPGWPGLWLSGPSGRGLRVAERLLAGVVSQHGEMLAARRAHVAVVMRQAEQLAHAALVRRHLGTRLVEADMTGVDVDQVPDVLGLAADVVELFVKRIVGDEDVVVMARLLRSGARRPLRRGRAGRRRSHAEGGGRPATAAPARSAAAAAC